MTTGTDRAELDRAVSLLFDPADVIELRAIYKGGRKRIDAGYFDGEHRAGLVDAAVKLNGRRAAVYVTLNQLDPQLLGRYCNRVEEAAGATATDANVLRRRWLLIDLDPVRPKDTSATAAQVEAARQVAQAVLEALQAEGWPPPILADSGNGTHLLYRVDLANDDDARKLIECVLAELARRFDTADVKVDRTVFNAGRICKLYGTVSNKGDNTPQTPWRLSRIVSAPEAVQPVPVELLEALLPAPEAEKAQQAERPNGGTFDLADFLRRLGIDYTHDRHDGRDRYRLARCPFNAEHVNGEAAIFRSGTGVLGFKCLHNGCADKRWHDVRNLIDGPRDRRNSAENEAPAEDGVDDPAGLAARVAHLPENWEKLVPPARPFVLHPYIPMRAVSALIGSGTSSKTMLECEWTVAIVTGSDWRGHTVQPGDVVIVTWEDERDDYHAKLYSYLQTRPDLLPMAEQIRSRVHFIQMHGSPLRLVAPDDRGRPAITMLAHNLADFIMEQWPDTVQVFVETVSRANGCDELNEAMAQVVAAGEIVAHKVGCGFTDVHHVSKAASSAGIVDAGAGRGGVALVDNCRATTVLLLVDADSPPALWPPGFTREDFTDREIVLVENSRTSYGRRAKRMFLERRYPETGAPYLAAISTPERVASERTDAHGEKLLAWLTVKLATGRMAERAIVDRREEYGLSERHARGALARLAEAGKVIAEPGKQHGDRGRGVTFYRLPPQQQPLG